MKLHTLLILTALSGQSLWAAPSLETKSDLREATLFFGADGYSGPKIKPRRKLSATEELQRPLINCVVKFAEENRGGVKGVDTIGRILESAMDTSTSSLSTSQEVLDEKLQECELARKTLDQVEDSEMNLKDLGVYLSASSDLEKVKKFLKRQYFNVRLCTLKQAGVAAAMGIGLDTGISKMTCYLGTGSVRNYIGIKLALQPGFGAKAYVSNKHNNSVTWDYSTHSKFAKGYIHDLPGSVLGLAFDEDVMKECSSCGDMYLLPIYKKNESKTGVSRNIGLGFFVPSMGVTTGVRVFNGKKRWDLLMDQLK